VMQQDVLIIICFQVLGYWLISAVYEAEGFLSTKKTL